MLYYGMFFWKGLLSNSLANVENNEGNVRKKVCKEGRIKEISVSREKWYFAHPTRDRASRNSGKEKGVRMKTFQCKRKECFKKGKLCYSCCKEKGVCEGVCKNAADGRCDYRKDPAR